MRQSRISIVLALALTAPAMAQMKDISHPYQLLTKEKSRISLGDSVRIRDSVLEVVGLSDRTNMFVVHYAFVSLAQAQEIIGYPNLVTCYMVDLTPGAEGEEVRRAIREEHPGLEVYEHAEFVANNTREMESGVLPLLYAIALVGSVVLTTC